MGGFHPVPMATINKLVSTLKTLATYLDGATDKDAKARLAIGAMLCRETLKDVEPEVTAIGTGGLLIPAAV